MKGAVVRTRLYTLPRASMSIEMLCIVLVLAVTLSVCSDACAAVRQSTVRLSDEAHHKDDQKIAADTQVLSVRTDESEWNVSVPANVCCAVASRGDVVAGVSVSEPVGVVRTAVAWYRSLHGDNWNFDLEVTTSKGRSTYLPRIDSVAVNATSGLLAIGIGNYPGVFFPEEPNQYPYGYSCLILSGDTTAPSAVLSLESLIKDMCPEMHHIGFKRVVAIDGRDLFLAHAILSRQGDHGTYSDAYVVFSSNGRVLCSYMGAPVVTDWHLGQIEGFSDPQQYWYACDKSNIARRDISTEKIVSLSTIDSDIRFEITDDLPSANCSPIADVLPTIHRDCGDHVPTDK